MLGADNGLAVGLIVGGLVGLVGFWLAAGGRRAAALRRREVAEAEIAREALVAEVRALGESIRMVADDLRRLESSMSLLAERAQLGPLPSRPDPDAPSSILARVAPDGLSRPVIKALAVGSGISKAVERLRAGEGRSAP